MAIYVSDTFTEASNVNLTSHTPDTGTGWTEVERTGTPLAIVDATVDKVRADSSVNNTLMAYSAQPNPSGAEYSVSFAVSASITDTFSKSIGVFARRTGTGLATGTGYFFQILPMGHAQADRKLFKVVGGVVTELAASDQGDSAGKTFEFIITDAKKSVKENGVEILSTTDNTITSAGDCGLYWGYVADGRHIRSEWQIDNFVSQSIAAIIDGGTVTSAATGVSSATGDLIINASSTTDSDGNPTSTGDLIVGASVDSDVIGTSSASGEVLVVVDGGTVTSAATGVSSATGDLIINSSVASDAVGESSATGELLIIIDGGTVSTDAVGVSSSTGDLVVSASVDSNAVGASDAVGDLIINASVVSDAVGESSATGNLQITIDGGIVTSNAVGVSSSTGDLIVSASVDSNAVGASDAVGDLIINASVVSDAIGESNVEPQVIIEGQIVSAEAVGVSSSTGDLIISASVVSDALLESITTGDMFISVVTSSEVLKADYAPYMVVSEVFVPYVVVSEDFAPYIVDAVDYAPYGVESADYSPYEVIIEEVDMAVKGATFARKFTIKLNGAVNDPDQIYIWWTKRGATVGTPYQYDANGIQDAEIARVGTGVYVFKILKILDKDVYELEGLAIWESGETWRLDFDEVHTIGSTKADMTSV